jgi:2-amino-4-hydroxy-6-hydroxymethyldihydropteridine diphosphokinase
MVENMSAPTDIPEGDLDLDGAVIVALGCNDKGVCSSCEESLEAALARYRAVGVDILARSAWWSS